MDVIVIGEHHTQPAGPLAASLLTAAGRSCEAPVDCVLLELDAIPASCREPRPRACARESLPNYKRRLLTPSLLKAAKQSGAAIRPIDHPSVSTAADDFKAGKPVDWKWIVDGRSEWMANEALQSGCERAVFLVGRRHVERISGTLMEGAATVTMLDARCTSSPGLTLREGFFGGMTGVVGIACSP